MTLRADAIKVVLARLHLAEAGNGGNRIAAYKMAITGSELSTEELAVLRRAAHIKDDDVSG